MTFILTLAACTGAPYTEDPESFRGWCDVGPSDWGAGDRPWFTTLDADLDTTCLELWSASEDTEGCTLWRLDTPADPGTLDLSCVPQTLQVGSVLDTPDLSDLEPPTLVDIGECGLGLAADWLPSEAWQRGVVLELQIGAQRWFFTRGSVSVWPDSGGEVTVRVVGPDGAEVGWFELGSWDCDGG